MALLYLGKRFVIYYSTSAGYEAFYESFDKEDTARKSFAELVKTSPGNGYKLLDQKTDKYLLRHTA